MSPLVDSHPADSDTVRIPKIWVAVALSVLIHVLALWISAPNLRRLMIEKPDAQEPKGPLVLQIVPPSAPRLPPRPPPALPQPRPPVEAAPRPPAPKRAPPPPPPVAAPRIKPAPVPDGVPIAPPPPPKPAPPAATAPPAPPPQARERDFASMVEARRRARDAAEPPSPPASAPAETEDEKTRSNRIVASNLGLDRQPTFGRDPGGGIFQITRMSNSDAEFAFYGWNKEIRRRTNQLIEVRRGEHGDIRLAVVRRMIAIIREHEQADFLWESRRLGREIMLSARLADNAGLEEFMLREFFGDARSR